MIRDLRPARVDAAHLRAVFLASSDLVAAWSARIAPTSGILAFTDADLPRALQIVAERKPPLVIVEQRLAASARGAAFVECVRSDPDLAGVEVQVLSAERIAAAAAPGSLLAATPAVGTHLGAVERAPVRRAPRLKVGEGLKALVDGHPVRLVDLSTLGAQLLSAAPLRPNQRVRVVVIDEATETHVRAAAGVAWSTFERPSGRSAPYYRVGVEFSGTDPSLDALYERLRRGSPRDEPAAGG